MDPISGKLDYYDCPAQDTDCRETGYEGSLYQKRKVENEEDEKARIPLYAHTQYWKTGVVGRVLHADLVRPREEGSVHAKESIVAEAG